MMRTARRSRSIGAAAMAAVALVLAAPPAGQATTLSGLARVTPTGPAASGLSRQGVRIVPDGAADAATTAGVQTVLLPAGDATFAATSRLQFTGAIALRRRAGGRTRTVRLASLQLRLGARTRAISATVGGRRIDVLTLDLRRGDYTVDASSTVVRIGGARAALTAPAARAIARGLGLRSVRRGTFGVVAVTASAPVVSGPGVAGPTDAPSASGTAGASTGGAGGSAGTAPGAGTFTPPTPLARPASAVDVASSSLRWHLRESFVRYVRSGEGVTASDGASAGPAASDGVSYDYDFTPAGGWYDPASGTARLLFTGRITFSYAGHGIDIRFADPQIELAGDGSRVLATFSSAKASGYRGLGAFTALEPGQAQTAGTGGPLFVFAAVPARVTSWANDAVMSGFYPAPDDAFGHLDLRFARAS